MKVLCIGEALIDMICTDRGSRLADGQNFLKKAGGAPANVAAAIAALGGEVDMAAKVGKDPFGQHLIDLLNWLIHAFYKYLIRNMLNLGQLIIILGCLYLLIILLYLLGPQ